MGGEVRSWRGTSRREKQKALAGYIVQKKHLFLIKEKNKKEVSRVIIERNTDLCVMITQSLGDGIVS